MSWLLKQAEPANRIFRELWQGLMMGRSGSVKVPSGRMSHLRVWIIFWIHIFELVRMFWICSGLMVLYCPIDAVVFVFHS
jgi:hypothetical protein